VQTIAHPLANLRLSHAYLTHNARLAEAVAACAPLVLGGVRLVPEICHILDAPPATTVATHHHHTYELSFVTAGEITYAAHPGLHLSVATGQAFLMPPEHAHGWHATSPGTIFGFQLLGEPLVPSAGRPALAHAAEAAHHHFTLPEEARRLFALVQRQLSRSPAVAPPVLAACLGALIATTLEPVLPSTEAPHLAELPPADRHQRLFRQACLYLEVNLAQAIQAADVAAYVGISTRQLNRIFLAQGGTTVGAWLAAARLARAHRLLRETTHTVKEIARACGYPDPTYFCRIFRRATGRSPLQFSRAQPASGDGDAVAGSGGS